MSYPCKDCGKFLANSGSLKIHSRIHTGEKPYACTFEGCSYRSSQIQNLNTHIRIHTGEKPYKCNHCDASFAQQNSLTNHALIHTGEKPFKCNQCEYAATQKTTLELHLRTHTGEKPYKCNQCEYASTQNQQLKIHMLTHTGERPYVCTHEGCNKTFTMQKSLDYHILKHTGERPHACQICSKTFRCQSTLKTHMLKHDNIKPFKCEYEGCLYSGRTSGMLASHIRQNHTGEKPYTCETCNKSFTQLSKLTYHTRRIHTGERPFSCEFDGCGLSFIVKGALEIHRRVHTGERPFKCTQCDAAYMAKGSLTSHFYYYHTEEGRQTRKREEQKIATLLDARGISYKREHRINFNCMGGSYCYIDFVIIENGKIIFLEIDENQHVSYQVSCELKRMTDVHSACLIEGNTLPIHFVRYNPHKYSIGDRGAKISRKARESLLVNMINNLLNSEPLLTLSLHYLFYNLTPTGELMITHDPEFSESAQKLVAGVFGGSSG